MWCTHKKTVGAMNGCSDWIRRVSRDARKVVVEVVAARNLQLPGRSKKKGKDHRCDAYCKVTCLTVVHRTVHMPRVGVVKAAGSGCDVVC